MKKILALGLALAALMICCCFVGCAEKEEKKQFKLGFDAEYPPFGYLDPATNDYTGFDIELAQAVCDKLGWELVKVPIDWEAKDMALESGEIDCIWSGFTINERENDYEWTTPYVNNTIVVLTKESAGINTLADLAGKTVSVQADSSGESALKDKADLVASFKDGKYLTCKSYTTAFSDLETEAIDALVIDVGVANSMISGKTGYKILAENITSEQYGIGFKKGNTELRDTIQQTLNEVAADGKTVKALAEKYSEIADQIVIGK